MKKIGLLLNLLYGFLRFRRWSIYISPGARVYGLKHISIGMKFGAGKHFWMEAIDNYQNEKYSPKIIIGNNVSLSDFCHISAINQITIKDNVLIGSKVHITDHYHGNYGSDDNAISPDTSPIARPLHSPGGVEIGKNVWVGDGVIILPNVTIGDGAVVGANSVVNNDVPSNSIVAGAPARVVKKYKGGIWYATKD
ncbi:MAG: acyltransferase [Pseudomonadota bacterium]